MDGNLPAEWHEVLQSPGYKAVFELKNSKPTTDFLEEVVLWCVLHGKCFDIIRERHFLSIEASSFSLGGFGIKADPCCWM